MSSNNYYGRSNSSNGYGSYEAWQQQYSQQQGYQGGASSSSYSNYGYGGGGADYSSYGYGGNYSGYGYGGSGVSTPVSAAGASSSAAATPGPPQHQYQGVPASSGKNTAQKSQKGKARTTVLRRGGGELWEDQSLMEWDPNHFRLFVGDLGNDVSDELLESKFSEGFPSFVKARVVRDKHTTKSKGYGFVAYSNPEDFLRAWKTLNKTYVGSRPVKIQKASTPVAAVDIGNRKARQLDSQKKKKAGFGKAPGAGVTPGHAGHKPYVRR